VSFAFLVTAVLAVQTPSPTARGDSAAYLDAAARRLVAAARTRRETIDRSITAYRTRVRERIGVGASFIDGLVRVDLARALRSPTGWRLDFFTDAAL
jgi:hypothetical protein